MPVKLSPRASIVVLTGAGISAESGLQTFRGAGGFWEGRRAEEVASPAAFSHDPELVHRFYNARRAALRDPGIEPNEAHRALARLAAHWPGEVMIVTQNVDDLHDRAGTQHLRHMHGELLRARCTACGAETPWTEELSTETRCPSCSTVGGMRPAIVWFGEMPMHMPEIEAALQDCSLFVAIGTSGNVYPAAGFVQIARMAADAMAIEVNLEPSSVNAHFSETRTGPATITVPALVDELLGSL